MLTNLTYSAETTTTKINSLDTSYFSRSLLTHLSVPMTLLCEAVLKQNQVFSLRWTHLLCSCHAKAPQSRCENNCQSCSVSERQARVPDPAAVCQRGEKSLQSCCF